MKVVILCGGRGSRLREYTEHVPKPMVRVGQHPILWHILRHYAHHGFDEFVLCLGYKGHLIKEYFLNFPILSDDFTVDLGTGQSRAHGTGSRVSWKVTLVDTGDEAATGARLARVAPHLGGQRFMLTYGDGLTDLNARALLDFHDKHGKIGTVTGVHPPARFGELQIEGTRVTRFHEKPQVRDSWINGGFFVFEPGFLDYLRDEDDCTLEGPPLQRLAQDGELEAFQHPGFWQCMDTFRDWKYLNDLWASGRAPWTS